MDEHVFLRKHRKRANRFRESDLFGGGKKRGGFPAMSHVCRTWKTPDNTSEIGAVIDITGRRVCPIAFCSLVRCRRVNPTHLAPSLLARQVIIGFRVQGEFVALSIVGKIWRATDRYETVGIWIFLIRRTKHSENTNKKKRSE